MFNYDGDNIYDGVSVLPNTKNAKYCSMHAPDGYVNVRNKKCIHVGRLLQPNYNYTVYSSICYSKHKKQRI